MYIICNNNFCPSFNKKKIVTKVTYKMEVSGLKPILGKCPDCGQPYVLIEDKPTEIPQFMIGEFRGMTTDQKKDLLTKRMNSFNKKDGVQEKKEYYRNKTIKKFLGHE